MDNKTDDGVITFAQIWNVVKASFPKAVIYVLVCVILSFSALFAVRSLASSNTYSATITFKQSDETIKATLDNYRASATNKAVEEVCGSADNATEIYETILETLTITAYIPEAYESDTSYVATTYTVAFEDLDIKGVTKEMQASLLDNICLELISYYSDINSTDTLTDMLAWGYSVDYSNEYLDILTELETRLSVFEETLSANIKANVAVNSQFATYRSSTAEQGRRTAYELLAQIDNIEYNISKIEDSVLSNGIYNGNATLNGSDYCTAKLVTLSNKLEELNLVKAAYTTQIANLGDVISSGTAGAQNSNSSNTIVVDISAYTELVEQLMEVETEIASIERQKLEVQQLADNISSNQNNAAYMTETETAIAEVISDILTITDDYNELVAEFEETVMPSTYASVSKPAAAYKDSIVSWSLLIIGVLAVAVIAYVVAFGQTWSRLKKDGRLDEKKEGFLSANGKA